MEQLVREGLRFSIVVNFVINLYVLPFTAELFLVPLILVFVAALVIDPENPAIIAILAAVGLLLFAYVSERVLTDPTGFFSRDTAENFLVAPLLSLALLPLLGVIAWYSRRELLRVRRAWPALNTPA